MLIVSSLTDADRAYADHGPARVISILSEDEPLPSFKTLPNAAHLRLYATEESCTRSIGKAARQRAKEIVDFISKWDGQGDILIHCNRGISRSMAAAFIILCMREPKSSETAIAARLRQAAPFADPCPALVFYADEILGRDGRMAEAIDDLGPPSPAIAAPLVMLAVGKPTPSLA